MAGVAGEGRGAPARRPVRSPAGGAALARTRAVRAPLARGAVAR
jgi:hypothetical protein